MADLKGTLETLIKAMYGQDSVVRFRPHHFPFTEPSAQADFAVRLRRKPVEGSSF